MERGNKPSTGMKQDDRCQMNKAGARRSRRYWMAAGTWAGEKSWGIKKERKKEKTLYPAASAFTKQSPTESHVQQTQCGKLMESLIRVCEAAIGVNLTIRLFPGTCWKSNVSILETHSSLFTQSARNIPFVFLLLVFYFIPLNFYLLKSPKTLLVEQSWTSNFRPDLSGWSLSLSELLHSSQLSGGNNRPFPVVQLAWDSGSPHPAPVQMLTMWAEPTERVHRDTCLSMPTWLLETLNEDQQVHKTVIAAVPSVTGLTDWLTGLLFGLFIGWLIHHCYF